MYEHDVLILNALKTKCPQRLLKLMFYVQLTILNCKLN